MPEFDKTNTFVMFVNDKGENERAPDRSGTLNVDGVEYFIDGWIKQGKNGAFLSGRIKPKRQSATASRNDVRREDDADPLPF